jgi:3-methyladenine DNA glycosylase AlkD
MEQDTQDKLKQIKASFRLQMNGVASQSMRDKGLGYKINWGIGLPLLKIIAKEYGKDYNLAIELWKENIRECKILATMIMPPSEMEPDIVDLWISQIPNQEIAEMLAFNLFQYLDDAKNYALRWLAADKVNEVICGYNVLARLFAKNVEFSEREINEFIDQAQATLSDENVSVRHSVVNALTRFGQMDRGHNKILKSAFKSYDLDIF